MASGLTRYNNCPYFIQYAILKYVKINGDFIMSKIVYPIQNCRENLSHAILLKVLNTIRDKVIEYNEKNNTEVKFVIFIDKESFNSDALFTNKYYTTYLEFRVYNNIVPGYTTCIEDLSIETFDKQFETAIKEIVYYVKHIGLSKYLSKINDIELSFAYVARRYLEKTEPFKKIIEGNAFKVIKRFPKYDFVWNVAKDVKKFNANKLVKHGKKVYWANVCKYDINSSFWSIPMTEYTGMNPKRLSGAVLEKEGLDLDDVKKYYMVKENMYFAKIKINKTFYSKPNRVDWLDIFNVDLSDEMWVTNVEIEDILDTYELSMDDIELLDFYILEKVPFLPTQKEFYKELHRVKAIAKSNNDTLLKNCLKAIGHCLHGFAIGNWFTDKYNKDAYYGNIKKPFHKYKDYRKPADVFLTPIDSLYFYSYARQHLLKILELFGNRYYFDTDSIVTERNNEAVKAYNEWVNNKYIKMGCDPKDYTHDGHTIGYLELEEECENFCHLSPKFYLWTHDNKLHSTTAGYEKNSIAKVVEKVSGKIGKDALQWFIKPENSIFDVGYISNGSKYIKNLYNKEKSLLN